MADMSLRYLIKQAAPAGLLRLREDRIAKQRERAAAEAAVERLKRFDGSRETVKSVVDAIRKLTPQQCADVEFLETFVPSLGLNDEALHEQPGELRPFFGKGLHIWQYPNQLARYLAWIAANASGIRCYLEIGCRWGGMFILVSEWLRKNGGDLNTVIAVDPIAPTPFIDEYFKLLNREAGQPREVTSIYLQHFSTAPEVRAMVERYSPDYVFVDGDHTLEGAMKDHLLVRDHARIIVHHDVSSNSCRGTTFLWEALKAFERERFELEEFTQQYPSVDGSFLGIGVMKRRS